MKYLNDVSVNLFKKILRLLKKWKLLLTKLMKLIQLSSKYSIIHLRLIWVLNQPIYFEYWWSAAYKSLDLYSLIIAYLFDLQ